MCILVSVALIIQNKVEQCVDKYYAGQKVRTNLTFYSVHVFQDRERSTSLSNF